jgi:uncharacterized repeat protein (TIGR02543 family)
VTYDGNGSTGGAVPVDASSPYASGATVTVLGNTGSLVKTGSTFAGWNTAANGSGTSYAGGATFTMGSGTVTLYAQWALIPTYTVTGVVAVGGSGLAGVTVTDGTRTVLTDGTGTYTLTGVPAGTYVLTPTLTGYTFTPASTSITVSGSMTVGQTFTGSLTAGPPAAVRVVGGNGGGGCGAGLGALLLCGLCLGLAGLRRRR